MNTRNAFREEGFSLVELMVAVAIGLLVVLVVTMAYVNATGTQRSQSDKSRVEESMRFALDSLSSAVRKAGYRNPAATGSAMKDFCGSDVRIDGVNSGTTTKLDPASSDLSGTSKTILNSSDVLRVRYHGEGQTLTPFTADASVLDCLGNSVGATTFAEDTFFVAADAANNNEPSLFCYTTNASASGSVAIVPGVESLQIMYGEDSNGDGVIERFVDRGSVANLNRVRSVMLSVVARSASSSGVDKAAQTFIHFKAGSVTPTDSANSFTSPADGRVRELSGTTTALKNICAAR